MVHTAAEILYGREMDLEQMVDTYGKAILRYCHLLLRDYHEAQDAVQTTFLRAYYYKNPIRGEFAPWLYKIAYNCCIDVLRKRKRFLGFLEKRAAEKPLESDSGGFDDGMAEEIREALGTLTPEDRALVISRLIDDMDYDQLSQIYSVKVATLRKRYERAKKRLADALREQGLAPRKSANSNKDGGRLI